MEMKIYIRITALLLMLSMLIVTLASCGVTEGIGVSVNDSKNSGAQENSLSEIVISEADKVLGDSPAYKLEELKAELGGDGRGEHKDECEYDRDDEHGDKVLFPDHIPELLVRGDNKDCGKDIEEKGNSASNKPAQSESDNATEHGESLAPVSDTERFIYGLMITELGLYYDVFSAMVTLSDGTEVYGIGFTDYSEAFKSVSEDKTYFSAGFISLVGEAVIPTTEWENGIEMERISDIDSEYGFICSFTRDAFSSHFVVFGEYVIYGINDAAGIVFETREYDRMTLSKELDPRLGSLYSYDDERYLVDYDLGNNLAVGGISVSEMIDYEALREEVERAIREQDQSLVTVDIETSVYIAQEALNAYLLSMQEETFFGYPVSELIRISSELDPMSCIRITDEGLELIEVQPAPPPTPSGLMKWLTGITAGLVVAGGVALACFGMPHLGGAVIGAAIQVFTEVIIENKVIGNIDWRKVAVASLAGALTATMGLMGDSLVGGATNAVFTLMDGGDLTSAVVSFGIGVGAGVALGGAFKLVGKGLGKLANKLPAPSKASKVAGDTLNVGDDILRKADDPLDDAIRYQSGKQVQNAIDAQLVLDKADDGAYKMTQNLRKHIELDGGPTGKSGIKGTHNKDNLLAEIEALGGQYRIKAGGSAVDGIEVIEYRLPMKDMSGEIIPGEFKNKVFTKTVYDPAKMSTEEFLDRGLQAANNAAKQSPSGKLPREWVGVDDSGVTWRGYCDLIEDKVTSFFPVD